MQTNATATKQPSSKTNALQALKAKRAKVESGEKVYTKPAAAQKAIPTRSASPDPQHKAALAHANKVASERRKGDASKGVQLPAPKSTPTPQTPATSATPQVVSAPATTLPAVAPLKGAVAVATELTKHGCSRMADHEFNNNLAVAAANLYGCVAVHELGGRSKPNFVFVGANANDANAAEQTYYILRFAFYEGGYQPRKLVEGITSGGQHNAQAYCNGWSRTYALRHPVTVPPALLSAALQHGTLIPFGAEVATPEYWYAAGVADAGVFDLATAWARWARSAKVGALPERSEVPPVQAETKLETKSARTRKRDARKAA